MESSTLTVNDYSLPKAEATDPPSNDWDPNLLFFAILALVAIVILLAVLLLREKRMKAIVRHR